MKQRVTVGSLGRLPMRPREGHKGTFGTVTVVGGCCAGDVRYVGAPALAALGALRSGCGLCRVVAPEPILDSILTIATSATGKSFSVDRGGGILKASAPRAVGIAQAVTDSMVIGPGFGEGKGVDAVVQSAWKRGGSVPLVLDADGLNSLSRLKPSGRAERPLVITPHPGEARHLVQALGVAGDPYKPKEREPAAIGLAKRLGCIVVLKGAGTIVTDGERLYVNSSGGPWMATGGTGDVLSGVIGGLIAQQAARHGRNVDYFPQVCLAVLAHGRAGDAWAKEKNATGGMLAIELAERVVVEVERLRR